MQIRTAVRVPDWNQADALKAAIKAEAEKKLATLLRRYGADNAPLHAVIEKDQDPAHALRLKVYLYLPGRKAVVATSSGETIDGLASDAISKLYREAKRHFASLRNAHEYRRKARRERLHDAKAKGASRPAEEKGLVEARIEELRPVLEEHARRELAYLRAVGELPYGSPQVADVVDEALTTLIAQGETVATEEEVLPLALQHLYRAIDAELEAERIMVQSVPLDSELPDDPEDDAEEMVEEEFYEFFQPDEHVTLADVLHKPWAEGKGGIGDEQSDVSAVELLKELPRQWRRAFLLLKQDGFEPKHIATILDLTADTVEEVLNAGRAYLEAKISEKGLSDWWQSFTAPKNSSTGGK